MMLHVYTVQDSWYYSFVHVHSISLCSRLLTLSLSHSLSLSLSLSPFLSLSLSLSLSHTHTYTHAHTHTHTHTHTCTNIYTITHLHVLACSLTHLSIMEWFLCSVCQSALHVYSRRDMYWCTICLLTTLISLWYLTPVLTIITLACSLHCIY